MVGSGFGRSSPQVYFWNLVTDEVQWSRPTLAAVARLPPRAAGPESRAVASVSRRCVATPGRGGVASCRRPLALIVASSKPPRSSGWPAGLSALSLSSSLPPSRPPPRFPHSPAGPARGCRCRCRRSDGRGSTEPSCATATRTLKASWSSTPTRRRSGSRPPPLPSRRRLGLGSRSGRAVSRRRPCPCRSRASRADSQPEHIALGRLSAAAHRTRNFQSRP